VNLCVIRFLEISPAGVQPDPLAESAAEHQAIADVAVPHEKMKRRQC
jgi:hypothetical protein